MPRLTNKRYLEQRHLLRINWQQRKAEPFATLPAADQVYLYGYFAPTHNMSDAELIEFRTELTERIPTLPQLAGRAYKKALPYLDPTERSGPPLPTPKKRRSKRRQVVVGDGERRTDKELVSRLAPIMKKLLAEDMTREQDQSFCLDPPRPRV